MLKCVSAVSLMEKKMDKTNNRIMIAMITMVPPHIMNSTLVLPVVGKEKKTRLPNRRGCFLSISF